MLLNCDVAALLAAGVEEAQFKVAELVLVLKSVALRPLKPHLSEYSSHRRWSFIHITIDNLNCAISIEKLNLKIKIVISSYCNVLSKIYKLNCMNSCSN